MDPCYSRVSNLLRSSYRHLTDCANGLPLALDLPPTWRTCRVESRRLSVAPTSGRRVIGGDGIHRRADANVWLGGAASPPCRRRRRRNRCHPPRFSAAPWVVSRLSSWSTGPRSHVYVAQCRVAGRAGRVRSDEWIDVLQVHACKWVSEPTCRCRGRTNVVERPVGHTDSK